MKAEMQQKEKLFTKLIHELEDKHRDYFAKKTARDKHEHDRISNHFFLRKDGDNTGADLLWLDGSDLRSDIKEEVQKIYNQIFNS